jgi:hypothetical protein
MTHGYLPTRFDWRVHVGHVSNARSLGNFPMQANGAEMMHLAACLAVELGLEVLCPVHDAFLIMAPLDRIDHDVAVMRSVMAEVSPLLLKLWMYLSRYRSHPMDEAKLPEWWYADEETFMRNLRSVRRTAVCTVFHLAASVGSGRGT